MLIERSVIARTERAVYFAQLGVRRARENPAYLGDVVHHPGGGGVMQSTHLGLDSLRVNREGIFVAVRAEDVLEELGRFEREVVFDVFG